VHFDASLDMTARDADEAVRTGALLLDVREDFEWVRGHAPDATHIPMSELNQRAGELPTDRLIACVCHMGGRSSAVAEALNRGGWQAVNVSGGMEAWAAAGLPVVDDSGQAGSIA
jgi:rhodanese-related sulfurtransferase